MAVILGSIGTLVECSELQRRCFNLAFEQAGLSWHWDQQSYQQMLRESGGESRIELHARERNETVDAGALHQRKTELFLGALEAHPLPLREGISNVIRAARTSGLKLAFASTSAPRTVERFIATLPNMAGAATFSFVGDGALVSKRKPDAEIYRLALDVLGIEAHEAIAIEDNPDGASAALGCGIRCIAFAGSAHAQSTFPKGATVTSHLNLSTLGLAAH